MRFNEEGRRLCISDNDTCPNLAGYKETTKGGVRRYHTRCDRHRRPRHNNNSFTNPKSKRFIPLVKCAVCSDTEELHRHRIKRGLSYRPKNVIILCRPHHELFHSFELALNSQHYYIKRRYPLKNETS